MDQKYRGNIPRRKLGPGPLINAGALVYCTSSKRYLFLLRTGLKHDGTWGIVGGRVEDNESIISGLYREITEEIGMDFSKQKIVPVEKFTSDRKNFEYHTFLITVPHEFVPILNDEHRGYCWVPLTDYPKPLHPGVWRSFSFQTVVDKLQTLQSIL